MAVGGVKDSVAGRDVEGELQADHVDIDQPLDQYAIPLTHDVEEEIQAVHGLNVDADRPMDHSALPLA